MESATDHKRDAMGRLSKSQFGKIIVIVYHSGTLMYPNICNGAGLYKRGAREERCAG